MKANVRMGIVLPLVGVTVAWVAMLVASALDLGSIGGSGSLRLSTYVVLAGLALASGCALVGFKLADAQHASEGSSALVGAVYRFTSLMVILALVFDTIFVFVTFLNSFNYGVNGNDLGARFLATYLPILLTAGLIVFVLLQTTMYRKSAAEGDASDKGLSETQKALAIGYSVPVLGTAFAIIFGMVVYDIQRNLEVWSWVLIQAIVGGSIIFGTRFAAKARAAKPVVRAPRVAGAAGAVRLNYVLSIVFAGIVSVMSFSFGEAAVSALQNCNPSRSCYFDFGLSNFDWWVNKMIPAFLLLVSVQLAVYLTITLRNKEVASAS
jgi:hypothetical protein